MMDGITLTFGTTNEILLCARFAEGDSRILQQMLVRDLVRASPHAGGEGRRARCWRSPTASLAPGTALGAPCLPVGRLKRMKARGGPSMVPSDTEGAPSYINIGTQRLHAKPQGSLF